MEACSSRPACSRSASTTRGWQCPALQTESQRESRGMARRRRRRRRTLRLARKPRADGRRSPSRAQCPAREVPPPTARRPVHSSTGLTFVPMPACVNSPAAASGLAPIDDVRVADASLDGVRACLELGEHPPPTVPAASSRRTAATSTSEMSDPPSSGSASQPSTSVMKMTLYAPSAAATAPAASSALTL